MHDEYQEVLERAMTWARKNRPKASPERHAAFANSVAYAVTGASGGYGGPSVREHAASRVIHRLASDTRPIITGKQLTEMFERGEATLELAVEPVETNAGDSSRARGFIGYDQAVEVLGAEDGVIFGPLTNLHRHCWQNEYCFNDDPEDLRALSSSRP